MDLFGVAHGWGAKRPSPKICHTYPTMMKLGRIIPYLRKNKMYINHMTYSLSSADISIFWPKISKFKEIYRLHFDT